MSPEPDARYLKTTLDLCLPWRYSRIGRATITEYCGSIHCENTLCRGVHLELLAQLHLEEFAGGGTQYLLSDYEEDASATWVYTRALWLFRNEGATEEARRALKEAVKSNPHVPSYLLGVKKLPATVPSLIGMSDETEAEVYFADCIYGWLKTPGALDWFGENVGWLCTA